MVADLDLEYADNAQCIELLTCQVILKVPFQSFVNSLLPKVLSSRHFTNRFWYFNCSQHLVMIGGSNETLRTPLFSDLPELSFTLTAIL